MIDTGPEVASADADDSQLPPAASDDPLVQNCPEIFRVGNVTIRCGLRWGHPRGHEQHSTWDQGPGEYRPVASEWSIVWK